MRNVSKEEIDALINRVITQYPDGLSRGLDYEVKRAAFTEVMNLFESVKCKELAVGGMTIEIEAHILDHFVCFFDAAYVYYYSQPYGSNVTKADEELPHGWEVCYFNPTSWYFPGRCYTVMYRKLINSYKVYSSKIDGSITLWEGTKFNSHDKKDRRIIERKLSYYFKDSLSLN